MRFDVSSLMLLYRVFFFFSSRRRHTRCLSDWSSDVCSSDLMSLRSGRLPFLGREDEFLDHRRFHMNCNVAKSRFAHLLAAAALLVASASLAAQTKPVLITDLKVGDWAEVPNGYPPQWVPVTIAGPFDRGSYKINQNGLVISVCAYSTCIRHQIGRASCRERV